jgi:hypothetical protein
MTCSTCGDKGLVRFDWSDAPPDFGMCLCPAGGWFRSDVNAQRRTGSCGWQVWCAQHRVEPSRMFFLEEVLTAAELAAAGFAAAGDSTPRVETSREAALLGAGRTRRGKL